MTFPQPFKAKVDLPDTVYHYTSVQGLLSIAGEHRFHAGSTQALNDQLELRPGRIALEKLAEKGTNDSPTKYIWNLLNDREINNSVNERCVYVLSASENLDDAAQWINYADDGRGYAIGIRTQDSLSIESNSTTDEQDELLAGLDKQSAGYGSKVSPWLPVLYEDDQINDAFTELFEWVWDLLSKRSALPQWEPTKSSAGQSQHFFETESVDFAIAQAAHAVIQRVKGAAWKAENEYRRIAVLHSGDDLIRLKPSTAGLRSYVNLIGGDPSDVDQVRFVNRNDEGSVPQLPISEVICGPRAAQDYNAGLVEILMKQSNLTDVKIRRSEILLR